MLARMRVQPSHSNAWIFFASPNQKILQQATDPHDFFYTQHRRDSCQRHMRRHKSHSQRPASQAHRKILHSRPRRKKLGLPWKFKAHAMQSMLADRPSHHSLNLASQQTPRRLLHSLQSRTSRSLRRLPCRVTRHRPNHIHRNSLGKLQRIQSRSHDLRTNPRRIPQRHPDASFR